MQCLLRSGYWKIVYRYWKNRLWSVLKAMMIGPSWLGRVGKWTELTGYPSCCWQLHLQSCFHYLFSISVILSECCFIIAGSDELEETKPLPKLEKKRKTYRCGKNYVTLADIVTWPTYVEKKPYVSFAKKPSMCLYKYIVICLT